MKVVIVRDASEKARQSITGQFPGDWHIAIIPADDLIKEIEDANVLIPEGTIIDGPLLEKSNQLKLIQTGAGYDNVEMETCTKKGIYVANAAGINARAVAEHVWAFILCWYKNIISLNSELKSGGFITDYQGSELSEKVLGVVGLGNIGREVVRLAGAFDMKVIGFHYRRTETGPNIEMVDLYTLLSRSDIITLHVALSRETHHLIGQKEFGLMKPDTFLINTSRGAVVDETALIEALHQHRIAGAGLDVFATEPLPGDSPLRKMNNVILSPHNAGEPDGLYFHKKRFRFFAENIKRIVAGKPPQNALNEPQGKKIQSNQMIPEIILPEGYYGKILLVSVSGEGIKNTVLLRSGDLWHREILRNTETEIKNHGIKNALVHGLGGALVRFEANGIITIYGASQEFGACDKEFAAELIKKEFRDRTIKIRD